MSRTMRAKKKRCKEIRKHLIGCDSDDTNDRETLEMDAYYKGQNRKYKQAKQKPAGE